MTSAARAVTISRSRHVELARDMHRQVLTSTWALRRFAWLAGVAAVLAWMLDSWLVWGLAAVGVVVQQVVWRRRILRSLRPGLDVGQTTTVSYTDSGELTIVDATGQVWLPRGSAFSVVRYRGLVTVAGRALSFILPAELLTDADIAFLEGHGDAVAEDAAAAGPTLPVELEVSPSLQSALVAARTRLVVRSADFLVPYVVAPLLIGFAVLSGSRGFVLAMTLFCAVTAAPTVLRLVRQRRLERHRYPVGRTLRGDVTPDHLALSAPHLTAQVPWSDFRARRVSGAVVMLQRKPGDTDETLLLPRELFTPDGLAALAAAVPRTF